MPVFRGPEPWSTRTTSQDFGLRFGRVPMFPVLLLFAAGIALARLCWLPLPLLLLAWGLSALLTVAAIAGGTRLALAPLLLAALLTGWLGAEAQPGPDPQTRLREASDNLLRHVEGRVSRIGDTRVENTAGADEPARIERSQTIDIAVDSLEEVSDWVDRQQPARGGIRLTVYAAPGDPLPAFSCGSRLAADIRMLPPQEYHDAGVWSRRDYLLGQGIAATASTVPARLALAPAGGERDWGCLLGELRRRASRRLAQLPARTVWLPAFFRISPADAAMLAAMVTGDREHLDRNLRRGFERTGSFHLLVVSGLHLGVIAALCLGLLRRLGAGPAAGALVTILVSLAYAIATGFGQPVQRAFWMVALYLLARLLYRQHRPLNGVAFAGLCLLAYNPRSLFDASLQMTLLAVLAIAALAAPLTERGPGAFAGAARGLRLVAVDPSLPPRLAGFRVSLRLVAGRLQALAGKSAAWVLWPGAVATLLRLAELAIVALVVEAVMALPMAVYFHRVTAVALPVNLLLLPLIPLLLPCALITFLFAAAFAPLAWIPAAATAALLHLVGAILQAASAWRLADVRIAMPAPWQLGLAGALYALALVAARLPRMLPSLLAAAACLLAAAVLLVAPTRLRATRGALELEVIDVGQGDSLLVVTPDGHTLLVDAGGFGGHLQAHAASFDIGEDVVSPVLWRRGIRRLDAVALTHAHSDHMGGMAAVLRNFAPRELWVGRNPPAPEYLALLAAAGQVGTRVVPLSAGSRFGFGGAGIRVLAPAGGYRPGPEPANNDSLVLAIAYGHTGMLLEGDAEAAVEEAMLRSGGLGSTLLKVGHHGSSSSTTPGFLAAVAPHFAVISVGAQNRYEHPRDSTLERLEQAGIRTFRTDVDGCTSFLLDGERVRPQPMCEP